MIRTTFTLALALAACHDDGTSDAAYQAEVVTAMHDSIGADLAELVASAQDLQAAAPTHAWSATGDAAAIAAMRDAWKRTRVAYEHVEGATAPIFPDADYAMDARYDDYLSKLGAAGDPDPFDARGVTGMHGIERILYAPDIRKEVIAFERDLPGYQAAAWPRSDAEATSFKIALCGKLVSDAQALRDQWVPAKIDLGAAFQGLVGLMNEQKEKVNLAASGEEESRYANITLFDLRNNLDGTSKIYALFQAWIQSSDDRAERDRAIVARLGELRSLYAMTAGDELPAVPATWSSDAPSAEDLATPFGMLWSKIHLAVAPAAAGSVVFEMNAVATLLGFPEFVEE